MTESAFATPIERLLAERHWVRRLAVELVGESYADDVVQQTWLAAMRRPPSAPGRERAWLRSVVRKAAAKLRVREMRLRLRQERAAVPEALRAPDEMLAELEAQREVTRMVAELTEPYRSVVLWRFFDELSVEQIAARRSVPASTVRTQLSRGLERIRQRMRTERGDSWKTALVLPLLPARGSAAFGVFLMTTQGKIAGGIAAACLVSAAWVWQPWSGDEAVAVSELPAAAVAPTMSAAAPAAAEERDVARVPVLAAETDESEEAPALMRVTGRVLDDRGWPLSDVPIHAASATWGDDPTFDRAPDAKALGLSGAGGVFDVGLPAEPCDLVAGGDYLTLRGAPFDPEHPDQERFLVAVRAASFSGRVVDPAGHPVPGVRVGLTDDNLADFPGSLESTTRRTLPRTETDDSGTFELRAPATDQVDLLFAKGGYETGWIRCGPTARNEIVIVLRPVVGDGSELVAQVLDSFGRPVPEARVLFGARHEVTDARGVVRFPWEKRGWLRVSAVGYEPLELDSFTRESWEEAGSPVPMPLQLTGEAKTISGVLVDAAQTPVANMQLTLADGREGYGLILFGDDERSPEQIAAGVGKHCLDWERTDAQGRFSIGGLRDAEYRLRFFDRDTLVSVTSEPIAAGTTGVVVRIPDRAVRTPFRGRVVAVDGTPLPDVTVQIMNQLVQSTHGQIFSKKVDTAADGSFELPAGPRHEAWIRLVGDAVAPTTLRIAPHADEEDMRLVVPRKCRIRFLRSEPRPDYFLRFVDEEGEEVQMLELTYGRVRPYIGWATGKGRSPELVVAETAVALQYFDNGKLAKTKPVELLPGQLNEIVP